MGLFFLSLGVLEVLKINKLKDYPALFWFCNISPFLLAVGFFTGSIQFIKGLINLGVIPQFISLVSLTLVVFFGVKIEVFRTIKKEGIISVIIAYMIHLFTIFIALLVTMPIPATKISLFYSVVVFSLLFVFSFLFTRKKDNVNFIYNLKEIGFYPSSYYKYIWLPGSMILLAIPTYLLQNWISSLF